MLFALWRSRVKGRALRRNRCDSARISHHRALQVLAFAKWKMYVYRIRRIRVFVGNACRRLRCRTCQSLFDEWHAAAFHLQTLRTEKAREERIAIQRENIISSTLRSRIPASNELQSYVGITCTVMKRILAHFLQTTSVARQSEIRCKSLGRLVFSDVQSCRTEKFVCEGAVNYTFERKVRVEERGYMQRAVTVWRYQANEFKRILQRQQKMIQKSNHLLLQKTWTSWTIHKKRKISN